MRMESLLWDQCSYKKKCERENVSHIGTEPAGALILDSEPAEW